MDGQDGQDGQGQTHQPVRDLMLTGCNRMAMSCRVHRGKVSQETRKRRDIVCVDP